jgi:non-homologous end joining protein Ku
MPQQADVVDLMARLRASLESHEAGAKKRRTTPKGKKKTRKRAA